MPAKTGKSDQFAGADTGSKTAGGDAGHWKSPWRLGTTTGFALNPARDWGPRLAYTIIPVPNKSRAMWDYAWVPMLGPLAGALLATLLQMTVK